MTEELKLFIKNNILTTHINKIEYRFPEFYKKMLEATENFSDASIPERLWLILNDFKRPLCKVCNENNTKWKNFKVGYADFCSIACSNKSEEKKLKIKNTMIDRYGVEHALQNESFLNKSRETLLKNYGVNSPLQNKEINEKRKTTNLKKYGSEELLKDSSFRTKIERTFIEKYGGISPLCSLDVIEKTKNTRLKKYGSTSYLSTEQFRENYKNKTGLNSPSQHKLLQNGSLETLKNKEKLLEMYDSGLSLVDIANKIGCSDVTVGNYFKEHGIKLREDSASQLQIYNYISSIYKDEIIMNDRKVLDGKELDIFIPSLNIAIEYCGIFWHSDKFLDKNYHANKYKLAKEKGIRLITIFEDEWVHNRKIVEAKLRHILGCNDKTNRVYARKTKFSIVDDIKLVKNFLNKNHIQGYVHASKHYGLFYDGELVALMSVKYSNNIAEIVRYATSKHVIAGFTKLLVKLEDDCKNINVNKIVTFADLRWSEGDLYLKSGFTPSKQIKSDYKYVYGNKTYHKSNFRHKNLRKLPNYDENLSEAENTKNMKIYRIYDCGKVKYEKSL